MTKVLKLAFVAAAGLGMSLSAATAATKEANLAVTALVVDSCVLTAVTPLAFGSLDTSTATNQSVPGSILVVCSAAKSGASVSLGGGGNASGGSRRMSDSGSGYVPYSVFSDGTHSDEIDIDGDIWSGDLSAATPVSIPVYGQIPSGNYTTGAYSDTILVTLTY